jgi:hypothetical protein
VNAHDNCIDCGTERQEPIPAGAIYICDECREDNWVSNPNGKSIKRRPNPKGTLRVTEDEILCNG